MNKKNIKKKQNKVGRKLFDGKSEKIVVSKLEQAFSIGASDLEACFSAGISKSSLYRYEEINPEFRERKELLKISPVLKARQTVYDNLGNANTAFKFLERRMGSEFSSHQIIETKEVESALTDEKKEVIMKRLKAWQSDLCDDCGNKK